MLPEVASGEERGRVGLFMPPLPSARPRPTGPELGVGGNGGSSLSLALGGLVGYCMERGGGGSFLEGLNVVH